MLDTGPVWLTTGYQSRTGMRGLFKAKTTGDCTTPLLTADCRRERERRAKKTEQADGRTAAGDLGSTGEGRAFLNDRPAVGCHEAAQGVTRDQSRGRLGRAVTTVRPELAQGTEL